jgi:hypothetical protein
VTNLVLLVKGLLGNLKKAQELKKYRLWDVGYTTLRLQTARANSGRRSLPHCWPNARASTSTWSRY